MAEPMLCVVTCSVIAAPGIRNSTLRRGPELSVARLRTTTGAIATFSTPGSTAPNSVAVSLGSAFIGNNRWISCPPSDRSIAFAARSKAWPDMPRISYPVSISSHFLRHERRQQPPDILVQKAVREIFEMHSVEVPCSNVQRGRCLRVFHDLRTRRTNGIWDGIKPRRVNNLQLAETESECIHRQGYLTSFSETVHRVCREI